MNEQEKKPDFLIIGAQKAGTTWLWEMLGEHSGISLPQTKEIHYFGGVENYRKGRDWYYAHFKGVDPAKVTGEASTTYLYDRMPYWHNSSRQIEYDLSLPPIPRLITEELPEVKIFIVLRDPVRRAMSAYHHYMRRGEFSPRLGLKRLALTRPKLRILEYGYYEQYIRAWQEAVPPQRMRILVFEEDIRLRPEETMASVCDFLGLDVQYRAERLRERVHKSWGWTRMALAYYADPLSRRLIRSRFGEIFDRHDFLKRLAVTAEDIDFLRSVYLPQRESLEELLGRELDCWRYGIDAENTKKRMPAAPAPVKLTKG